MKDKDKEQQFMINEVVHDGNMRPIEDDENEDNNEECTERLSL